MDINRYIKDLLFVYDCVIIPDFGGFVTNYHSAEIRGNIHSILPPSKVVSFNKNLVHNDGLLMNFISRKEGISFESANNAVNNFVKRVNKHLSTGEKVPFHGIGSFISENGQNLQFEPELAHNFLVDSFGLCPVSISEVQTTPFQSKSKETPKRAPYKGKSPITVNRSAIRALLKNKRSRSFLIGVPIILTIALLSFNSKFGRVFKVESASFNPLKKITKSIKNVAENNEELIKKPEKESSELLINIDNPVNYVSEKTENLDSSGNNYFIIAGSFNNYSNAENFRKEKLDDGFFSEIIASENNFYRVSIFSSNSENDALNKMSNLTTQNGNLKVWILQK